MLRHAAFPRSERRSLSFCGSKTSSPGLPWIETEWSLIIVHASSNTGVIFCFLGHFRELWAQRRRGYHLDKVTEVQNEVAEQCRKFPRRRMSSKGNTFRSIMGVKCPNYSSLCRKVTATNFSINDNSDIIAFAMAKLYHWFSFGEQ